MQKFVVKKISRSTNITIAADDLGAPRCVDSKSRAAAPEEDLEVSSVKMCGYLKKKRNRVGGWNKLYFVLQNSLLMSYNSRDEYENKLVSFKDVICLIPGNTVLLPSLEPRFTIASNLNTFYTFRCDDNKICSKWITAILECLSRDIDLEGSGLKSKTPTKNFHSQQNLCHQLKPKPIFSANHSWENLPNPEWIANHNGRILLELNYLNCSRAKLPIGEKTAKILQKFTDNDAITTTKKVNFMQKHDENENFIRNADHNELRDEHDKSCVQFRLHEEIKSRQHQSKELGRISEMFEPKSESQRPVNAAQSSNGSDFETGTEEQMQAMSFGDETGDYSSIYNSHGNYQSVDSKKFNNKLNIEETYAEIDDGGFKQVLTLKKSDDSGIEMPEYATVDINKKREARARKSFVSDNLKIDDAVIYEDIGGIGIGENTKSRDESNIYELIDIPLRPSQKSRSLVWKNWSRMHLFDFTKRFKDNPGDPRNTPSPETINKRQKTAMTLSDFSKRFNYRSMRNKARKMCTRNQSAVAANAEPNSDKNDSDADSRAASS